MEFVILFILLGTISYIVIKRSVGRITKTPIWLLWLVLMTPALIWTGWQILVSEDLPIPSVLIVLPLVLCPLLYLWLIEIGKPSKQVKNAIKKSQPAQNFASETQAPPTSKVGPITSKEEKALRDCFPWGIYYLQKIDYLPQAILCLGKLRTLPENAYKIIKTNVENLFKDRFLVIFQETLQGQPFFALVPNPQSQSTSPQAKVEEENLTRPWFALGLLLITLFTTTVIGSEFTGVTVDKLETHPELLLEGLPYSLSLIAILGVHELSHYLVAVYYRIRTTLPYFIPIPFFLGTFGAFISIKSPTPHRKALFDVAIAGPVGGFLVTVPILVWGLAFSQVVAIPEQATMLNFEALDPRFSCLLAVLSKLALGEQLVAGKAIAMHPAAIAGYIGLIITALNLMPVGQLDGGHIVHGMFGQGKAIVIGQITRLLVFGLALVRGEFLIWAIILFFMPLADQPALNDVTELDDVRDFWGLMSLVLLVSILLPLPPAIAGWLNM
jgi:membrane-associated protease RseP (regulator of RpoE activity)